MNKSIRVSEGGLYMRKIFAIFGVWVVLLSTGSAISEFSSPIKEGNAQTWGIGGLSLQDIEGEKHEGDRFIKAATELMSSHFIENRGQIPIDNCIYYTPEGNVFLLKDGFMLRFREISRDGGGGADPIKPAALNREIKPVSVRERGVVLKYTFVGANDAVPRGRERCSWYTNYFIGSNPDNWYTEVPNYKEVAYSNVWDGIDIIFRLKDGALKYDIVLSPGAEPEKIKIKVEGNTGLKINEDGELVIDTTLWKIKEKIPKAFYRDNGEKIESKYNIYNDHCFGFHLREHDMGRAIVIDPLVYSTYVGGSSFEIGNAIYVDSSGNAYITGFTGSANYPTTTGAYDTGFNSGYYYGDVVVTKINSRGSSLLYSTYIGGWLDEIGASIYVDSSGNAYITGWTSSNDYPTTKGVVNETFNGYLDVFVTKLNPSGSSLLYSTFLGGTDAETGSSIVVDSSGNAYVCGVTYSANFSTTSNAYDTTLNGSGDGFVFKLNSGATSLLFSTFIGGSNFDNAVSLILDSSGNVYLVGETNSTDYPTTTGAYDTTYNGNMDCFVTKLNSGATSLLFSTYVGGSNYDGADSIARDSSGNIYLTGMTESSDYPTTSDAYDTTYNGKMDAFATVLNSSASALVYSTFIGGSDDDSGNKIALDSNGHIVIGGGTISTNYPTTTNAYDMSINGGIDAFITVLSMQSSNLLYSTFVGGTKNESCFSLFVTSGNQTDTVYFTGYT
ncbi:MAG: SBBP repeat-containing protein, partial [Thermoplasmata archaeon]|nr:SBBP repeat-containing protein [Thermoplasmata archaeon]